MNSLDVSGAVLWCNIGKRTNRVMFADRVTSLGFAGVEPQRRTPYAALGHALRLTFRNRRDIVIRPLENNVGYDVKEEVRTESGNRLTTEYLAHAPCDDNGHRVLITPDDYTASLVKANFAVALGECGPDAVTGSLVKIVHLTGGTRLRDRGGVYWIPGESLYQWRNLRQVARESCVEGTSEVSLVTTSYDIDTADAIVRGLTEEIESSTSELTAELNMEGDDALGERALQNRLDALQASRLKVSRYETIFNRGLSELHEKLEKLKKSEAFTVLVQASQEPEGVFA